MALIDPKTGKPVNSRLNPALVSMSAADTLFDLMAEPDPLPPSVIEHFAGMAMDALKQSQEALVTQGYDPQAAMQTSIRRPVTIELGLLMGLLRDAVILRRLSPPADQAAD